MEASTIAAAIAALSTLTAAYVTQFVAEQYRRHRDARSLAAGLAGELASYQEAVPMIRQSFDGALRLLSRGVRPPMRKLERPVDRFFPKVVEKIGTLGPDICERTIFVYGNIEAFRGALMMIHDNGHDMSDDELGQRLRLCLEAMDRVYGTASTLIPELKEFSQRGFWRGFWRSTQP